MNIQLDSAGKWTDADGKQWQLVPVQPVRCQTDAALAKAMRYGKKGKNAQAAAWDYMQGYMELMKFAPVPTTEDLKVEIIKVGFPLNENSANNEKYATLTIDGYEARFGMTGITAIVNALKSGHNPESLSAFVVSDAIIAFEELHRRMWEIFDAGDKDA
jgi:hypothetical protein